MSIDRCYGCNLVGYFAEGTVFNLICGVDGQIVTEDRERNCRDCVPNPHRKTFTCRDCRFLLHSEADDSYYYCQPRLRQIDPDKARYVCSPFQRKE